MVVPVSGAGFSRVTHPFATVHRSKLRFLVRLACVRHAASVRPEPGSNSPSRSPYQPKPVLQSGCRSPPSPPRRNAVLIAWGHQRTESRSPLAAVTIWFVRRSEDPRTGSPGAQAPGLFELTDAISGRETQNVTRTRFCVRLFRFQGAIDTGVPGTQIARRRVRRCLAKLPGAIAHRGEFSRYRDEAGASTPAVTIFPPGTGHHGPTSELRTPANTTATRPVACMATVCSPSQLAFCAAQAATQTRTTR